MKRSLSPCVRRVFDLDQIKSAAPPLPAAVVRRGIGRVLCRADHARQKLAYVYFDDRRAPGPVVSITRPRFARANRAILESRY